MLENDDFNFLPIGMRLFSAVRVVYILFGPYFLEPDADIIGYAREPDFAVYAAVDNGCEIADKPPVLIEYNGQIEWHVFVKNC